ncbi:MAG TPA: dTMP kinase [Thermoanaerobaculia bacterium]|nr:dTMP kinase [Thermoanaerobaculia bacterium]
MFITFEGIEGSGKTTQLHRLAALLRERGRTVVTTKEPGGTPLADRIRAILLDSKNVIDPIAEVLLFAASRRQHTVEVIRPAHARGEVVLCDRYTDSTLAYQGFGRRLNLDQLRTLNRWATGDLDPDLTFVFDLPEEVGLSRAVNRNFAAPEDEGRFEAEELKFHRRVREGYLALVQEQPHRYAVVDADGSIDEVFARTIETLRQRLPELVA